MRKFLSDPVRLVVWATLLMLFVLVAPVGPSRANTASTYTVSMSGWDTPDVNYDADRWHITAVKMSPRLLGPAVTGPFDAVAEHVVPKRLPFVGTKYDGWVNDVAVRDAWSAARTLAGTATPLMGHVMWGDADWHADGDILVAVDGRTFATYDEFVELIGAGSLERIVEATIEHADGTGRRVVHATATRVLLDGDVDTSQDSAPVALRFDRVSGSSHGLALTLAFLDALTVGDLSGGRKVAATGVVEWDAELRPIAEAPAKARTAHNSNVDVFFYPAGSLEPGETMPVFDDMATVEVTSVADVLDWLCATGSGTCDLTPLPAPGR